MKKEFILKEYTNKDILMHCSTKKEDYQLKKAPQSWCYVEER